MKQLLRQITILIAEDDDLDYLLAQKAFEKSKLINELIRVHDGEDLMDYLLKKGKYENDPEVKKPGIILLDLNMPKKDGREALEEIQNYPQLKRIPVVVLTTSKAQEDIIKSYDLGVNSYIRKPVSMNELVEVLSVFSKYWLQIVELPPETMAD